MRDEPDRWGGKLHPPETADRPPASAAAVARSAFWRVVEIGGGEVLAFVFMVVLARLLTPADYGLVAIATMTLMLAQLVVRHGLVEVLVQAPALNQAQLSTAFWINLGAGTLLALGLAALAQPLARLTGEPGLRDILLVLCWLCIPQAITWIYVGLLRRAMDFRGLALRAGVAVLTSSLVAVAMALGGFGVWSLVALQVVNALVSLVVVLLSVRRIPTRAPESRVARGLLAGALPLLGAGVVGTLALTLPTIVFGMVLPVATVGYFFVAQRITLSLTQLCTASVGDLSLSVLARLQHTPDLHRATARHALRLGGLICLPAFAGVALVAEPLVLALFGPSWAGAIWPLRLLMISSVTAAAALIAAQVILSFGRHHEVLRMNLLAILPATLVVCALAPLGLLPALSGHAVVALLSLVVVVRQLCRVLAVSAGELIAEQKPTVLATAGMILVVASLQTLSADWAPALRLAGEAVVGALAFAGLLVVLDPALCRSVAQNVGQAVRSRASGTA